MHIVLIEPYFTGSHARWAREWKRHSRHEVDILSLPGRFWKWRMHGAAVTLANRYLAESPKADLLVATDMLDLSLFLSLTRENTHDLPVLLYMHENQLTYPWSEQDDDPRLQRDQHYAFINYSSALSADAVYFNSRYHREHFCRALKTFVGQYPDYQNKDSVQQIEHKSDVLYPGIDVESLVQKDSSSDETPVLLWNHRWEYDKRPEVFFNTLFHLDDQGLDFELVVVGRSGDHYPPIFDEARNRLDHRIIHFGYAQTLEQYHAWLQIGDILPVTSAQDFFGLSVVESIAAGLLPLLPNRLAYPEHLPQEARGRLLYETDVEFSERLGEWIIRWPEPREIPGLKDHIKKYSWQTLIKNYDRQMEHLIG